MKKFAKKNLSAMLRTIAQAQDVLVPVRTAGKVNFGLWTEEAEVDLDTLKTVKSAKDAFFPQSENLYTCTRAGKTIQITPQQLQEQDFVLFGVKGCDVQGFAVLDRVFLSAPVDTFYATRRKHGTVVTFACTRPEETCFCACFGVDASAPKGDVAVWPSGDALFWQPQTEKGEALTKLVAEYLTDAEEAAVEEIQASIRRILQRLPLAGLSLEGWNGDALEEKFDSELWQQLYKPCLACGTCTFVCPTCQCYDIKDYDTGHGVQRYRCWDSCMYSDFTMMAHGNNRTSQMQRFRQRFMHKLVYFPANNDGMYSCTGCGRCVASCPASLNIVKVIKAFSGKEANAHV